jgi:hypothetical protein
MRCVVLTTRCSKHTDHLLIVDCLPAQALHTPAATPIHALEPILPVREETLDQSAKWHAQLVELAAMGFTDAALNIQILERYQGRLLRVVNYLSELAPSDAAPRSVEPMQE